MKFLHNEGTSNKVVDKLQRRRDPMAARNFLLSTCLSPPFTVIPVLSFFHQSWSISIGKRTTVKHALPTIQAARRRFDEHYNIIRIGLALNEVGGARAESDKGTNKKRPF